MTLRSVLVFLSLCTLIFADSFLSHFQEVFAEYAGLVVLDDFVKDLQRVHKITTPGPVKSPEETLFDGSFESCAKQCHFTKFYCRSFMVVVRAREMLCIMDDNLLDNLQNYFTSTPTGKPIPSVLVAAYDIKEKIDNVATITKDPTLLSEDRFHELLQGYGISKSRDEKNWNGMVANLRACAVAINFPKSKPKYFRKWLSGVESTYEHSMPVSTFKSTNNYEQVTKRRRLDDSPDFNVLMFLDLFSRVVYRNTETIYDPIEGTLYIHSPDIQLLFISYNKDDYIWAIVGKKVTEDLVIVGISKPEKRQGVQDSVIEDFIEAATQSGYNVPKWEPSVFDDDFANLWHLIRLLTGHPDFNEIDNYYIFPDNENLLLQDLSNVVPILHEKRVMPYTEQVRNSFHSEHAHIITLRK